MIVRWKTCFAFCSTDLGLEAKGFFFFGIRTTGVFVVTRSADKENLPIYNKKGKESDEEPFHTNTLPHTPHPPHTHPHPTPPHKIQSNNLNGSDGAEI